MCQASQGSEVMNDGEGRNIFVTLRFPHSHHRDKPVHYAVNLGVTLTIGDCLFGTSVNPDVVKGPLSLGIGEEVSAVRLVLGVRPARG